jgi:hypothetical protein
MKFKPGTAFWMGPAFCMALALAAIVIAAFGADERSTRIALRVTARWSFLLFWAAYAGGALATLFGPTFEILSRRGREFGLAFASAHLVHLGLVLWLFHIATQPPISGRPLIFFTVGIAWVYLLALLSVPRLGHALDRNLLRVLRMVGVEYIALAFFVDFVLGPLEHGVKHPVLYVPFSVMAIAGPFLRLAALAWRSLARARLSH